MATHAERNAETRRRLLEAGTELFAEQGYRGTSVAAIGERAGMSRGVVNFQFGTKEALLGEIVRTAVTEWERGIPIPEVDTVEAVVAAIDALLAYHRYTLDHDANRVTVLYSLVFEALPAVPSLREEVAQLFERQRLEIAEFVERAQAVGVVPAEVSALGLATWLTAALRGITYQYMVDSAALDLDATYAELRAGIVARMDTAVLA